jgi:hypothetical protein
MEENKHYKEYQSNKNATVLTPSEPICSPVRGIDITGIVYVGGMLHIQTAVINRIKNDNHGYFYLADREGNKIMYDYSVSFFKFVKQDKYETRIDYDEFVFDIPQNEIKNYKLYGNFFTAGLYTEGSWQVTFPLALSEDN